MEQRSDINRERERQTDRQTGRHAEGQIDRQITRRFNPPQCRMCLISKRCGSHLISASPSSPLFLHLTLFLYSVSLVFVVLIHLVRPTPPSLPFSFFCPLPSPLLRRSLHNSPFPLLYTLL